MNPEFLYHSSHIEQVTSMEQLAKVKMLDDFAFGVGPGIVGISMEELVHITEHGAVFAMSSPYGMIAETQVLTSPIEEHPSMTDGEAYCYGTAVHPQFREMGLAQHMFAKQEEYAKQNGKSVLTLTIRVENAGSLRARFKSGFVITGYDANCYGSMEEGGARLWLKKHIDHPNIFDPETYIDGIHQGTIPVLDHDDGSPLPDICAVAVKPGLSVDSMAHQHVSHLVSKGYQGVGMMKPTEVPILNGQMALIFQKHL
jgi:ribosomal protein S18 acetylase RimI-like enzyme